MSSVDIFGRSVGSLNRRGLPGPPGPRGAKGPPGTGGIESIVRWLPETALEQLRKIETVCLLLTDLSKDVLVKEGKYVTWISRSNSKLNAIAVHPSAKIVDIPNERHGLQFEDNLYKVKGVKLSPTDDNAYACICITFHVENYSSDEETNTADKGEQFLISNYGPDSDDPTNFRGISIHDNNIRIWGVHNDANYISIPFEQKKFSMTKVFVQYRNCHNVGSYVIIDKTKTMHGVFVIKEPQMFEQEEFFIGGQSDKKGERNKKNILNPFRGCISALEVYIVPEPEGDEDGLPTILRDLMLNNQ